MRAIVMSEEFVTNSLQQKDGLLKQSLLDALRDEKVNFMTIAEEFYHQPQRNDESYIALCREILKSLNQVLDAGNWDESLFLRNSVKPLKQLRERVLHILKTVTGEEADAKDALPAGTQFVYVSLFQSKGHDLRQWEMQLRSLHRYMSGRPAYAREEDIESLIRSKISPEGDAYVILAVPLDAIREVEYMPTRLDRQGRELVSLKEGAVTPDQIIEFVHVKKRYRFINGKLIEK